MQCETQHWDRLLQSSPSYNYASASCRYLTLSSTHPKYTWVLNGSQDYDPLCSICYQKLSLHFGVGVGRVETEPTVSEDERLKQVKVKRLTRTKDEDEKNLGTWHLRVFCGSEETKQTPNLEHFGYGHTLLEEYAVQASKLNTHTPMLLVDFTAHSITIQYNYEALFHNITLSTLEHRHRQKPFIPIQSGLWVTIIWRLSDSAY